MTPLSPTIDYPAIIGSESERVCELLAGGPLDAAVAGCPGWTLGDLGVHLVGVQRWATQILNTGTPADVTEPPTADQASTALRQSSQDLVAALSQIDPMAPCWNFSEAPQVAAFWFRRQACEVAVHRWDAEAAVSTTPAPIDPATAAHVIDEFLHMSLPRIFTREQIDVSTLVGDVHVHCTDLDGLDAPGEWTFEIVDGSLVVTDDHRKSAVALRGTASNLALALYQRTALDSVDVFGDTDVLARWSQVMNF